MTPCPAPLPADVPALVAQLTADPGAVGADFFPQHVDVYRARVLGPTDRLVILRSPGHTRAALLHDGCPAWAGAPTGDDRLTVSIVPGVWTEGDVLEVRTRGPGADPAIDLRYLAAVDGEIAEVFAVPRASAVSVHFAGRAGDVLLGVVDPAAGTVDLYRRAGARFAPVPPLTPPAPRPGPVTCDDVVEGLASTLIAPEDPRFEDGSAADESVPFTTDRWQMNLSGASALDVVVQRRPASGPGPRATWVYQSVGPDRWCRSGPVIQGEDVDDDLPAYHSDAPIYSVVSGVLPGRDILRAEASAYGAGAASWEEESTTLWASVEGALQPILSIQTHTYGGYGGGGGTSTGSWAFQPTTSGLPRVVAVALDVDQADRSRCSLGGLTVYRFDGQSYVPWYAALPATERDYAPDEAEGCRTSTWPTAW